jgi:hypothetical protein
MRILHQMGQPRKWLTMLVAPALAATALMGLPMTASAHQIVGGAVDVDCDETPPVVSVTVTNWTGNIVITRTSPSPVVVTKKLPPSQNAKVDFLISEIGGNGSYTASREGTTEDPAPVAFTVDCHTPMGTLKGDIQLCDGTHVDGGTIGATGPTNVPPQNNSLSAPVTPGTYEEQATSPEHYHFVNCKEFQGTGTNATIKNIKVPDGGSFNAIFYVAQDPGTLTARILLCKADGTPGNAATGTITIPGTTASAGSSAPTTVTTGAGTYTVTASNAATGNHFVTCGSGGGTVSGDKASASQSGVVTPDNNTMVTFYVQADPVTPTPSPTPAGSVQGASTGGAVAGGVLGAAVTQPNTGRSDFALSTIIALAMMLLGIALLLRQAFHGRASAR